MIFLFNNYPFAASVLILVASLIVGAIEIEALRSKAPAILTWVLGGFGLLASILYATYPVMLKAALSISLLMLYVFGIAYVLKRRA